jgi:citrate lyase subunit beta/citryl-CoA lyase
MDTVYADVLDEEGLRRETEESLSLGFDGKGVISATQAAIIHEIFTPSEQEYQYAVKILQIVEESKLLGGLQMPELNGKLLDAAVEEGAHRIIAFANANKVS